jgi:hypothetical protein
MTYESLLYSAPWNLKCFSWTARGKLSLFERGKISLFECRFKIVNSMLRLLNISKDGFRNTVCPYMDVSGRLASSTAL